MRTYRTVIKKSVASFLLVVLLGVSGASLIPTKTRASGLPVIDALGLVQHLAVAGFTGISASANASLATKEYALDPLAYMAAKIALQSVTKSVVNWINSGFDGSPAFVQDLQGEFLRVGDTQATRLVNKFREEGQLKGLPWSDDVSQAVLSGYFRSTSKDGFSLSNPYTLDKTTKDPAAFANGAYSKGGLDAWMSMGLRAGESPLGTYFALKNSVNSGIAEKQGQRLTEINQGDGFLAYRGDCGGGSSVTSLTSTDPCLDKPIKTPSKLISQAANKYLVDSGLDQYVSADEISEVIVQLMGQLVNNVIGGGGLSGVSKPSSGGGSSYIDRATDPAALSQAANSFNLSSSFLTTISNQVLQLQQYQANWQKISDAAASAKTALLSSSCVAGGAETISSQIDPVLSQSAVATGNASSALSAIEKIRVQLTMSASANPDAQTTAVSDATTAYQTLLGSSSMPSISDITYAQEQSNDSAGNTPASLFTQMTTLAAQAKCGA